MFILILDTLPLDQELPPSHSRDIIKLFSIPHLKEYRSASMAAIPLTLKSTWNSYGKVLGLLLMIVLGILFPQFHALSAYIQYLLMIMLFFAFLDIDILPRSF